MGEVLLHKVYYGESDVLAVCDTVLLVSCKLCPDLMCLHNVMVIDLILLPHNTGSLCPIRS